MVNSNIDVSLQKISERMKSANNYAALFDLDGVLLDTEPQYTIFWDEQGRKYLNETNFGRRIKGQTLQQIYAGHFSELEAMQPVITQALNRYQEEMSYAYIPGAEDFLKDLKRHGVRMAVVTSSDEQKMRLVHRAHPEFQLYFDRILTAEDFARSKPDPDCFLLGMKVFGTTPEQTFVFEDSFHGLQAGMASGATVFGLATTNSREAIAGKAHYIIDDFRQMTFERLLHYGAASRA